MSFLKCTECGKEYDPVDVYTCDSCGGEIEVLYNYKKVDRSNFLRKNGPSDKNMWISFLPLLPVDDINNAISLGEGWTPLIRANNLEKELGLNELYFKLEFCNPTGSFKDRQISSGISKANEMGKREFAIASSGNAGVALSAYSAKSGFSAYVWVSDFAPRPKVRQIQVYGAQLLELQSREGDISGYHEVFTGMPRFCDRTGLVPMVTARQVNPYVVEGSKTIAFEIVTQLDRVPDNVFTPVGGGGLLGGNWKGFRELQLIGATEDLPVLFGAQYGEDHTPVDRIGDAKYSSDRFFEPLDGSWAHESIIDSGGELLRVSDDEITCAQLELASKEGIFGEPPGVASFAGLKKAVEGGLVDRAGTTVCYVTGTGLKNIEGARKAAAIAEKTRKVHKVSGLEDSKKYL